MEWPRWERRHSGWWQGGAPVGVPPGCALLPGSPSTMDDLPSTALCRSPRVGTAAFLSAVPVAQSYRLVGSSMACRWRQGGRVATTPTVTFCRTALPLAKSPELRARDVSRAATVSQTVARKEIEFSVEYQVDAKIVKKEAELKAVRDRLKDTVSLRTDTEAELDRPDLSAAEKARLERVWTRLCGREDHLRKDKKFLLSGLRDLLDVGDNVEPVVDVQLKLESVNLKIDEKQKELDVVQADLEAIWQEQDDAKRVMRRREPTADHAYLDRVEMAVDRVEACLQEDKEYTQFVLQVFDAQANVLLRMLKQLRQVCSLLLYCYAASSCDRFSRWCSSVIIGCSCTVALTLLCMVRGR